MIVYRVLRFECDDVKRLDDQLRHSINGTIDRGGVKISSAPVERSVIEALPQIMNRMQEALGKRWEPKPRPEQRPLNSALLTDSALRSEDAQQALGRIEDMLSDGDRYGWAADTLTGIQWTIEQTGRVTDRQLVAISNIENARGSRE